MPVDEADRASPLYIRVEFRIRGRRLAGRVPAMPRAPARGAPTRDDGLGRGPGDRAGDRRGAIARGAQGRTSTSRHCAEVWLRSAAGRVGNGSTKALLLSWLIEMTLQVGAVVFSHQ